MIPCVSAALWGVSRTQLALLPESLQSNGSKHVSSKAALRDPLASLQCLTLCDPAVWKGGGFGALASGGLWKELSMWSRGGGSSCHTVSCQLR